MKRKCHESHYQFVDRSIVMPASHSAPERATAEEIAFLVYRLDVLSRWPDSDHRSALIAATSGRLRSLRTSLTG